MYYNTHCHHTHHFENEIKITSLFADENTPENNFFSAGFHPWQKITDNKAYYETHLIPKLEHKNCLALGEIGLDKINGEPLPIQLQRFKAQLEIGKNYHKPVILHAVRSHYEILSILNKLQWNMPFIFHGFNKSYSLGKNLLHKGAILSFGAVLFEQKFIENVFLPLWHAYPAQILLETDMDIIPVERIYQQVANTLNLDLQKIKNTLENTFKNTFNLYG